MNRRAGFTLVELLITITIMVVLLTLAVVSLRANQANARDEERKTDISIIAQHLETYYESGGDGLSYTSGEYPPTTFVDNETNLRTALRDIDPKALRAPNIPDTSPMSFTIAANNSSTQTPTASTYIYQPLTSSGSLCVNSTSECRKFVLYYTLETDSNVQKVLSKSQ